MASRARNRAATSFTGYRGSHGRVISSYVCPVNQQFGSPNKNMDKMIFQIPRNEEIYHESHLIQNKINFERSKKGYKNKRLVQQLDPSSKFQFANVEELYEDDYDGHEN